MSMMICFQCDKLVDTDYDLEGIWTSEGEYICEACTEYMSETFPQETDDVEI